MKKISITLISICLCVVILSFSFFYQFSYRYKITKVDNNGYYLMCYFVGSIDGKDEEQSIHFALSDNGYDYFPLNNNKAIVEQKLGTKNIRDPFIFRANNKYYIIGTDMDSKLGWLSNHSFVMFDSEDLIHWENERIIDLRDYDGFELTNRAWAPEVIYDTNLKKYMVYFSHSNFIDKNCDGIDDDQTFILRAYFNEDFTKLEDIQTLFKRNDGNSIIDADIVEEAGMFYLYYKYKSKIFYAYSNSLIGPYIEPKYDQVSYNKKGMEGSTMYKLVGTDTYIMIADKYGNKDYYMATTQDDDMAHFNVLRKSKYNLNFSPKHASVLIINQIEYETLKNAIF